MGKVDGGTGVGEEGKGCPGQRRTMLSDDTGLESLERTVAGVSRRPVGWRRAHLGSLRQRHRARRVALGNNDDSGTGEVRWWRWRRETERERHGWYACM